MSQEAAGLILKLTEGCQPPFPWLAASEKNLTPGNWKRAFYFVEFLGLPNISALFSTAGCGQDTLIRYFLWKFCAHAVT